MTDREINILNMFIATVRFDDVNKTDYQTLPEAGANFAIVKAAILALQAHAANQTSGAASQAVEQKSVLRAAIRRKMKRYSRTARAMNIDDAGFPRLFRIPDNNNDQLLLAAAREFVEEARRFPTEFAGRGIPASLADDLFGDVTALESAIVAKSGAQVAGVGATAGIDEEIERGMQAEIILD